MKIQEFSVITSIMTKICPFSDQCIFLHEESTKCIFGFVCERDMCFYKHEHMEDVDETNDVEDGNDENKTKLSTHQMLKIPL